MSESDTTETEAAIASVVASLCNRPLDGRASDDANDTEFNNRRKVTRAPRWWEPMVRDRIVEIRLLKLAGYNDTGVAAVLGISRRSVRRELVRAAEQAALGKLTDAELEARAGSKQLRNLPPELRPRPRKKTGEKATGGVV
jgi:hypothetical protein